MLFIVAAIGLTSTTVGTVAEAFLLPENSSITIGSPAILSADQAAFAASLDQTKSRGQTERSQSERGSSAAAIVTTASPSGPLGTDSIDPTPIIAPQPTVRVPEAKLPSLRGAELLDQLALLTPSQLGRFVNSHPESIDALISSPPAASVVAADWATWSGAERAAMMTKEPKLIGSVEGFPYEVRDVANRSFLSQAEGNIRKQLDAGVGRAERDQLNARWRMLEQVRKALVVGPSGNSRQLISLDATGEGRAVIAVGDPSTADYVDYLIPGMFSDVNTQIVVLANGADAIATQQQAWLKKLNPGVSAAQLPTVATFAWIGYQTPNIVNVVSMNLAREGQASLTASIEGLRAERAQRIEASSPVASTLGSRAATGAWADSAGSDSIGADSAAVDSAGTSAPTTHRPDAQPYVAILAHSYGTTAAMLSLQDDAVHVDALAIVGSPGSPARSASDLKVTDDNVWVGAADTDPVPQTGIFGSQPSSPSYGAHRFGVNGATDPITGAKLSGAVGHNDYFVAGSESLRNMLLIGIGRGDLVLGTDGQSALVLGKGRATVSHSPRL